MNTIELLELLTESAKKYRNDAIKSVERNRHMNEIEEKEVIQQRHIDAVLTDFINFIGVNHGIDYAMYTSDLKMKLKNSTPNGK